MSYTSYEEVIIRYPMIKTWAKTEVEVNSDLIYYGEMELNGRMASHFTVPFAARQSRKARNTFTRGQEQPLHRRHRRSKSGLT